VIGRFIESDWFAGDEFEEEQESVTARMPAPAVSQPVERPASRTFTCGRLLRKVDQYCSPPQCYNPGKQVIKGMQGGGGGSGGGGAGGASPSQIPLETLPCPGKTYQ
jgi:hypothetical protein